jgi:hypothetical protein
VKVFITVFIFIFSATASFSQLDYFFNQKMKHAAVALFEGRLDNADSLLHSYTNFEKNNLMVDLLKDY